MSPGTAPELVALNWRTDFELQRESYPSWGYELACGSTTFWESWNAVKKNGTVRAPSPDPMANPNSLCAPPLASSVGDWLYRQVAGIAPDFRDPGFHHILVRPRPGGKFSSIQDGFNSIRGYIRIRWSVNRCRFALHVAIRPNTRATVYLPTKDPRSIAANGKAVSRAAGVAVKGVNHGAAIF